MKRLLNVSAAVKEGRATVADRHERPDHPANLVDVPEDVLLYLGPAPNDLGDRYAAFFDLNGTRSVAARGRTEEEVREQVDLLCKLRPTVLYQAFRQCFGHDYASDAYRSPEQRRLAEDRVLRMLEEFTGL